MSDIQSDITLGLNTTQQDLLQQDTADRLDSIFNRQPYFAKPEVDPGKGYNPNLTKEIDGSKIYNNFLYDVHTDPKYNNLGQLDPTNVPYEETKKYLDNKYGYMLGRDNEDLYSKSDWWLSRIGKGIGRFAATAVTKTGTGLGYLGGYLTNLDKAFDDGAGSWITAAGDNAFAKFFEKLEDKVKDDWLPVYQEAADRNKGFWGRMFTDSTFWTNDFADGAAFMASAFIPGMAVSKFGLGAKLATNLSKLGLWSENTVLGGTEWGTAINKYLQNAEKIKQGLDLGLTTALNTASEATFEAMGVRDKVLSDMKNKGYSIEEANEAAGKAAQGTFLANAAALSASNLWEANLIFKALGKGATEGGIGLGRKLASSEIGEASSLVEQSKWSKIWNSKPAFYTKSLLEGVGVEGLYEENIQLAIQRYNEGSGKYKGFWNQWYNQTKDAITGDDPEAAMNIGVGGLMGGLFSTGTELRGREYSHLKEFNEQLISKIDAAQNDWLKFGDVIKRDAEGNIEYKDNKPVVDVLKMQALNFVANEKRAEIGASEDISNATLREFAKKMPFASFVEAHIKAGAEDQLMQKLDALKSVSPQQLIERGFNPEAKDVNQKVDEYKRFAQKVIDLSKSIDADILEGPKTDPNVQEGRRNHLFNLGVQQIALQEALTTNSNRLSQINSKLASNFESALSDNFVDTHNALQYQINSQEAIIDSLDKNRESGEPVDETTNKEHQDYLKQLKTKQEKLVEENAEIASNLKKENNVYQYEDAEKNRDFLNKEKQSKLKENASITNTIKSLNNEFYKNADLETGYDYFSKRNEQHVEEAIKEATQVVDENTVPTGNQVQVKTKLSTGEDYSYNLKEGETYLGKVASEKRVTTKGVKTDVYNNDTIKVVSIAEDGKSAVLSINGDAAVTFSMDEIGEFGRMTPMSSLSNIQKFYLKNRNKSFFYQIPITKGKDGKPIIRSVAARLSLNKDKDTLMVSYTDPNSGKVRKVVYNSEYLRDAKGNKISINKAFDLTTLNTEDQAAVAEQQKRLRDKFENQVKYIEKLIQQNEADLNEEKARTEAIEKSMFDLEEKVRKSKEAIQELTSNPEHIDKRTKSGLKKAVESNLKRFTQSLNESEALLKDLQLQKDSIDNKVKVLRAARDSYYNFYNEIDESQTPVNIGTQEQSRIQQQVEGLTSQDNKNSAEKLSAILSDTEVELSIIDESIEKVEGYIKDLKSILKRLDIADKYLDLVSEYTGTESIRKHLRKIIADKDSTPEQVSDAKDLLKLALRGGENKNLSFIFASLNDSIKNLENLQNQAKELQEKRDRLVSALQVKEALPTLIDRLNAIKDIYNEFTKLYETEKVKAGVFTQADGTVQAKDPNQEVTATIDQLVDPETEEEIEKPILIQTSKPVLTETGLFKTFARHYNSDSEINSDPAVQRFFKFTSDTNISGDYYVMPITSKNDTYGISYINADYPEGEDMKLVVVKKVGNEYKPVGVDGKALEAPTKDNIIYTNANTNKDLTRGTDSEKLAWVKNNFTTGDLTDAQIKTNIDGFLTFVKSVQDSTEPMYLKITNKSTGAEKKEPKNSEGLYPQESVKGRIVSENMSEEDWKKVPVFVATSGLGKSDGKSVEIDGKQVALGRVVAKDNAGNIFRLYNRKFTLSEVDNVAKALIRYNQLLGRKDLTVEQNAEKVRIEDYLRGTLFFGQPIVGKPISKKQIWFSNGLHVGEQFLTHAEMTEDKLTEILTPMYHQVTNPLLNKGTKFYEPIFKADNTTEWKEYPSYKQYLMDGSNPVLYTNVVKKSESITEPQLKGVYLTFSAPDIKVTPTNISTTKDNSTTSVTKVSDVYNPGEYVVTLTDSEDTVPIEPLKNLRDGVYRFLNTTPSGFKYILMFTKTGANFKIDKAEVLNNENQIATEEKKALLDVVIDAFNGAISNLDAPMDKVFGTFKEKFKTTILQEMIPKDKVTSEVKPEEKQATKIEEVNQPQETRASLMETMRLAQAVLNKTTLDGDAIQYRVKTKEAERIEDINVFKKWMSEKLPQFPVHVLDNLIDNKAWGAFINGAIHIYENAEEGTGFHEAFEAVWATLLSPQQRAELNTEFRNRKGQFLNPFTSETKDYSKASDYDIREVLAEDFRSFVLNGSKDIQQGQPKRNSIWRKIWNAIKSFFGLSTDDQNTVNNKINKLFSNITSGALKMEVPSVFNGTPLRSIPGQNQAVTSQIIEGVHSMFFTRLFANNENMESLLNGENKGLINRLYKEVKAQLTTDLLSPALRMLDAIEAGKLDESNLKTVDAIQKQGMSIINKFESDIIPIYKDFLKRFGIDFEGQGRVIEDEEIDEILKDKESTVKDSLGILDTMYIDSRNLALSSVRLLIASLSDATYRGTTLTQNRNDLNLPKLIDYNKALNTLLNELEGTVSVYRDGKYIDRVDLMFEKLDGKYKEGDVYRRGYEWIAQLKRRLKYQGFNGQSYDRASLSDSEIRLLTAFEKSFSNNRNLPLKLIVDDSGEIYSTDPIVNSNITRLREDWRGNAKSLTDGVVSINNQATLVLDLDKLKDLLYSKSFNDKIELLHKLGIDLSVNPDEIETRGAKYYTEFNDAVQRIKSQIEAGNVRTFDDLFGRQVVNGPMNKLIEIEMSARSEEVSLQYLNAEGKPEYSITLPSLISNVVNALRNVNTLEDFVRTNPQFGKVVDGIVLLNSYQFNSSLLQKGGLLFDSNGKKKKDIKYHLFSGMASARESDGSVTADLKYPDKIAQELFQLLEGTYFTVINSDKSSEFGLNFGHFVEFTSSVFTDDIVSKFYLPHLRDEMEAAITNRKQKSNIQYYGATVEQLGHFRDIVSTDTVKQVLDGKVSLDDFLASASIRSDIKTYIKKFLGEQKQHLLDNDIITQKPDGNYVSNYLSKEQLHDLKIDNKDMTNAQVDNLVAFMFINHQIAVREQHKLIYGHPALYKDLPKRSAGATSTKEAIILDKATLSWMDTNMSRTDGKVRSSEEESTFKVYTYKDNIVLSSNNQQIAEEIFQSLSQDMDKELAEKTIGAKFDKEGKLVSYTMVNGEHTGIIKGYMELNEADAQAYMMPDFYRDLLFGSSKWSTKQEKQWQYEMAYERIALGKEKVGDKELVEKGSPEAIMPTLKPQYFGYQVNDSIMHTTFLKHSAQPKFFRYVQGTAFENEYLKAKANQADVIGFESGEKVGNMLNNDGSFTSIYKDGKSTNELPVEQNLYTKYYGIQVEMTAKSKEEVLRGTQMTKLIMSNLIKNGVPITPSIIKNLRDYNNTLSSLMQLGKQDLLRELGLQKDKDNSYVTDNLEKLVSTLREEAIKRDLPDNIVEALELDPNDISKLKYKFDTLPIREKIDNILNSIVDSRVISQKIHGKPSVQIAVTLNEKNARDFVYLKDGKYAKVDDINKLTIAQKKSLRMTSSELKFYRLENGKISKMEVMLPWYFKDLVNSNLKIEDIDPRLLEAIGFRIPTQALSQIDNIIVKGFLTKEQGDIIIVPSEIVGKAGSDFDIDKLNIYLPNYYVKNGNPIYLNFKDSIKETKAYYEDLFDKGEFLSPIQIRELDRIIAEEQDSFSEFLSEDAISKLTGTIFKDLYSEEQLTKTFVLQMKNYDDLKERVVNEYVKRALENQLIKQTAGFLELKENYRQLVMPNSANTLKALESEILAIKGKTKDSLTPTNFSEWKNMALTRLRFVVGKQLVGVGAIHITSHTLSQVSGITLVGTYKIGAKDENGEDITRPITIRLPHNSKLDLTNVTTLDGQWISELLSEAMTGFVDAAKDPFVFELNMNFNTVGTYFYLMKLGVPMSTNAFFHTQPAIEEYVKNIDKNNSIVNEVNATKDSLDNIKYLTLDKYYKEVIGEGIYGKTKRAQKNLQFKVVNEITKFRAEFPELTDNLLKNAISKLNVSDSKLTRNLALMQISALEDYLEYNTQSGLLGNFIRGVGYDTQKTKNIIENRIQESNWNKVMEDNFIANPEQILNKTFIGEAKTQKDDIKNMFKDYFMILNEKVAPVMEKMIDKINNPNLRLKNEEKADMLNRFQNFILNYLIHTTPFNTQGQTIKFNNKYDLFRDQDNQKSLAKQLVEFKKKYPDNEALKELFPIISTDRTSTDNIKLFTTKMSSYESNVAIESLKNLKEDAEYSNDNELKTFVNQLVIFAALQSGVQVSPISYTKILPVEIYSKMIAAIMDRVENDNKYELDSDLIWKQFHQNNYQYKTLVPSLKTYMVYDDMSDQYVLRIAGGGFLADNTVSISEDYDTAQHDFITIRFRNNMDRETAQTLRKNKEFDKLYNTILYQKGVLRDGSYIYHPINKLGNKMYQIEAYGQDTESMSQQQLPNSQINSYVNENNFKNLERNQASSQQNNVSLRVSSNHAMSYNMPASENLTGRDTTTVELAEQGLRTATTRSYALGKIGDIITFEGRPQKYRITGVEQLNENNTKDPNWINQWSQKEQWTVDHFNKALGGKTVHIGSFQTSFVKVNNNGNSVVKIISGGQTGIDRLGLEIGEELGIETGGTSTPGFYTEKGNDLTLRDRFKLNEISKEHQAGKTGREFYLPRTEQNVLNSDGTVYFASDLDSAGKIATQRYAKAHGKPFKVNPTVEELKQWIAENNIKVLNVAGNRGSKVSPEMDAKTRDTLRKALTSRATIQGNLFNTTPDESFGNNSPMTSMDQLRQAMEVIKQKEEESKKCND